MSGAKTRTDFRGDNGESRAYIIPNEHVLPKDGDGRQARTGTKTRGEEGPRTFRGLTGTETRRGFQ